jgi:hypothetical protein
MLNLTAYIFVLNTKTMSFEQHFYDIIIVSSTKIMFSNNDILYKCKNLLI